MKKIDITPTWGGLIPWMLQVLEDPSAPEKAKDPIRSELLRLGLAMDRIIKENGGGKAPRPE